MAETGHSEVLEDESQGAASTANAANAGVMDEFTAPPVHSGAGWTQAEFFVDGNHSRVRDLSRSSRNGRFASQLQASPG